MLQRWRPRKTSRQPDLGAGTPCCSLITHGLLLLPLPLLVYWLGGAYRDRGRALRVPFFNVWSELTGQQPRAGAVVIRKTLLRRAVLAAGWLLIVLAWPGPDGLVADLSCAKSPPVICVIVDLSGSMGGRRTSPRGEREEEEEERRRRAEVTGGGGWQEVGRSSSRWRQGRSSGPGCFSGDAVSTSPTFTEDHATVRATLDECSHVCGPKLMGDAI